MQNIWNQGTFYPMLFTVKCKSENRRELQIDAGV